MSLSGAEIRAMLAELALEADEPLGDRLAVYLDLLLRWNARMNLTSIREPGEIVRRHFAESLLLAAQIPAEAVTVLDFGSGAGLPGIPVALARPGLSVTLAESQGKKAAFLLEAVRTLELKAEVWSRRVEEMPAARRFDGVMMRAVDKMAEAVTAAWKRVAAGGVLLILTSRAEQEQVQAAAAEAHRWREVSLPHLESGVLLIGRR